MRALLSIAVALMMVACARAEDPLPLGASREDCATCHEDQAAAFATSAHARSERSPVLEALVPRARRAWGDAVADGCMRCHAPEHARLAGDVSAEASVTCVSCHAAVGNRGERDGLLLVDPSVPLGGPFDDAEPTPAHASRASSFVSSASLCGTCHEVTGPAPFVERTLSEHRAASPEPTDPSCAECHMPSRSDGPIALGGAASRPRRAHAFVGLDPPWGERAEVQVAAAADARSLLASALALSARRAGERVEVRLTNAGARHAVPTGVSFLRDVWVDVEVRLGALDETRARVVELGDQPTREGRPVALITDADDVERRRLDAGQTRAVEIEVPREARVVVRLRARAIREDILVALGLTARAHEVPVLEVAAVELAP